jgi:hypothetical protein
MDSTGRQVQHMTVIDMMMQCMVQYESKYKSSRCMKEGFMRDYAVRLLVKQHNSSSCVKEGFMMATAVRLLVEQYTSSSCVKEGFIMGTTVGLLMKQHKPTGFVKEGFTMDTAVRLLVELYKSSRCENTTERNSLCKSAVRLVEQLMASMAIKQDMAISMRNKEYAGKVSVQLWDTGWIELQLVM